MEPETPIEETLKASARKRRAEFGSNPSMPNPMRARLHEEVASLNREQERRSWRFNFAWPRFAIAAAAAVLVVGTSIFWQWQTSTPPKAISAARQTEMAAPAPEARERTDEKQGQAATVASETGKIAAAAPPAAKSGAVTQQFAQVVAQQEPGKASVPNVLSNFRLEQNGESVRVIDADGSTYTGRMERLALTDARAMANQKLDYAARTKAPLAASKEKKESANEYYIHASGYNTQLKKPLSFEGNYIADMSSANEMRDKDEKNAGQARIVGTAKIEGEPPVEVNAAAVPP